MDIKICICHSKLPVCKITITKILLAKMYGCGCRARIYAIMLPSSDVTVSHCTSCICKFINRYDVFKKKRSYTATPGLSIKKLYQLRILITMKFMQ